MQCQPLYGPQQHMPPSGKGLIEPNVPNLQDIHDVTMVYVVSLPSL